MRILEKKVLIRFGCIFLLAVSMLLSSCQKNNANDPGAIRLEGVVESVSSFGSLVPSIKPDALKAAGIEYGDLLVIQVGDNIVVSTPYVDAFTQAGNMSPSLCNYNQQDKELELSLTNGSFVKKAGGKEGDRFIIKMDKKKGYLHEYNLLKGTYSYERSDYSSDEVFANFREMNTTGLKSGVLFRSTSPINFTMNKVRYTYTSELCRQKGLKTIIDIADSDDKVVELLSAEENEGSYMHECYQQGNIIGLAANADYIDDAFLDKVGRALKGIISHPAPYLIHCNEGKDRTGFYCILIEALCGASVEEIKTDYMLTFENLYHQEKGSEKYELTWEKNGFRMLWHMANPQAWEDVISIDWDKISLDGVDIAQGAYNYILKAGLTPDEINTLKKIISEK